MNEKKSIATCDIGICEYSYVADYNGTLCGYFQAKKQKKVYCPKGYAKKYNRNNCPKIKGLIL